MSSSTAATCCRSCRAPIPGFGDTFEWQLCIRVQAIHMGTGANAQLRDIQLDPFAQTRLRGRRMACRYVKKVGVCAVDDSIYIIGFACKAAS
ncbi:hypothetical protein FVE85_8166 [Porphyridium purpureum]|uniref:Uncharacterized protein n=1 Tax=Porphyridium purpureum TaxID=35688 RepID=A0A5J4YMJ2_PORPP|nr:hypothetical protein FVE85_8166 [Porphyridium purpureum]|eukprot:POR5344..scf295_9